MQGSSFCSLKKMAFFKYHNNIENRYIKVAIQVTSVNLIKTYIREQKNIFCQSILKKKKICLKFNFRAYSFLFFLQKLSWYNRFHKYIIFRLFFFLLCSKSDFFFFFNIIKTSIICWIVLSTISCSLYLEIFFLFWWLGDTWYQAMKNIAEIISGGIRHLEILLSPFIIKEKYKS